MKFKNGEREEEVYSVGELIELLGQIPPETEFSQGFGEGVRVQILKTMDDEFVIEFEDTEF